MAPEKSGGLSPSSFRAAGSSAWDADGQPSGEEQTDGSQAKAGEGDTGRRSGRKQVLLRLDPAVHAAVAKWAADDLRSVNAQIEVILRRALVEAGRDPHPAPLRKRGRPKQD